MATIASLIVDIAANTASLTAGVEKVQGQLDGIGATATKLAGLIGVGFSATAVIAFGKSLMADADNLTRLRDKTGLSTDALQRFRVAGDDAGATVDEMTDAISKMQVRVAGDDQSAEAGLRKLGIAAVDFKRLGPEQQFKAVSDAIRGIADPAEQAKIAVDVFGKSGAAVLPVLKRGFDDVKDSAVGMSADTIKALDDAGDILQKWGTAAKGVAANFAVEFVRRIQSGFNEVKYWEQQAVRDAEQVAQQVADMTKKMTGPKLAGAEIPRDPYKDAILGADLYTRQLVEERGALDKAAAAHTKLSDAAAAMRATLATINLANASPIVRQIYDLASGVIPGLAGLKAYLGQSKRIEALNRSIASSAGLDKVGTSLDAPSDYGTMFDFVGPKEHVATTQEKLAGLAPKFSGLAQILDQVKGRFAEVGRMALNTLSAVTSNLASGNLFGAVVAGITGIGTAIAKLWTSAEKQVNPVRQAFVDAAGGLEALDLRAHNAGVTLTAMLNAKNPEIYKKAIDDLNTALQFQDQAMQTLTDTVGKWNINTSMMGPVWDKQELRKKAQELFQDWSVLHTAGIDQVEITQKMSGAVSDFVNKSIAAGIDIPLSMKPMLQNFADMGDLVDANGAKITDLSKINFAQTITEQFKGVLDAVNKLVDAITRGLNPAIRSIPSPNLSGGSVDGAASGGFVTAHGIQHFAFGGNVLGFSPRGTDTVPAMLTPGEVVLNAAQQRRLAGALGGGTVVNFDEMKRELSAMRADLRRQAQRLPGDLASSLTVALQQSGLGRR